MVTGTTTRVSVDSNGNEANFASYGTPSVSADGRYVAFHSDASNLVAGDSNNERDVFVRNTVAGTTIRVSDGFEDTDSHSPAISGDGRYIAFSSFNTNTMSDFAVFVRDTVAGTTTRVSADSSGNPANGDSYVPAISADGRYIAFPSVATNLVPGATNGQLNVVVRANPEPTVSAIAPSTLSRGATTPVTITGTGFIPGALVTIDGTNITVSNVHVVSPTTITANVTVDSNAAHLSQRLGRAARHRTRLRRGRWAFVPLASPSTDDDGDGPVWRSKPPSVHDHDSTWETDQPKDGTCRMLPITAL